MITIGVPFAPLVFKFVALRVGYRWIYWGLALVNSVQFTTTFFFGPETRYVTAASVVSTKDSSFRRNLLAFRRIDSAPLSPADFFHPVQLLGRLCVALPAAAHAMIILWGSSMIAIEIPQIYPERFSFNTQQVGLQNIALLVGTIVGEQVGGIMSDKWMWRREKTKGSKAEIEYRLWLGYIEHTLAILRVILFLVLLSWTKHWTVSPLIGAGIAAAGNQIVTTVMITHAIDCYPADASAIGDCIALVRHT
ncbi:Fc.00g106180.m01.CDS01 [Cosmosporella sp. VM-42]